MIFTFENEWKKWDERVPWYKRISWLWIDIDSGGFNFVILGIGFSLERS